MNNFILLKMGDTVSEGFPVFKILYWLFGICMNFLMDLLNNQYFIAIIIFTIVTRLLLLPINVRQQKTMAKTTRLQPKIQKIQKKYDPCRATRARATLPAESCPTPARAHTGLPTGS